MKWTTFFFILLLECSLAQSNIAFLRAPTTPSPLTVYTPFDAVTSSLEIVKGMPFVHAHLDGKSGQFLLDTGAPTLVLNEASNNAKVYISAESVGTTFQMASTKVKSFKWASFEKKHFDALALDIHHLEEISDKIIKGIIGYDILKEAELYVDYEQAQILLLQPGKNKLHSAATPLVALPFEMEDHLPVIRVQIGHQVFKLGLDTGAGINLLSQQYEELLKEQQSSSVQVETVQTIDQNISQLHNIWIDDTQLNNQSVGKMKYAFADLSALKSGKSWQIDGILGYPFFSRLKWSIDYPNRMLYIWEVKATN